MYQSVEVNGSSTQQRVSCCLYIAARSCSGVTIENSNLEDMSGLYGDQMSVTCDEGFNPADGSHSSFLITCTEKGSWDGLGYCEGTRTMKQCN